MRPVSLRRVQDAQGAAERLRRAIPGLQLRAEEPMSAHTTLRLGGPAALFCCPETARQLQALLRAASNEGWPVTVLGHGSNLLVLDGGIDGLVLCLKGELAQTRREGCRLTAGGGAALSGLARFAAKNGLQGLGFAEGIPGTVGGGVVMNAGAYGGELSQVASWVEGLLLDGSGSFRMEAEELAFGYRASRLQQLPAVVTAAGFALQPGDPAQLEAELQALRQRRAEKQPLDVPSAGSTFKRPAGGYAAALIDQCGLKGARVGGAQVSEKHAGFLVNLGGTAADFLALMQLVQQRVQQETGILLEPEVRILGEPAAS